MAADAAPAAVSDPHDTTGSTRPEGAQPGFLASALAAVEPARPAAFTLDPAAVNAAEGATAEGVSSAAFHGSDTTPAKGTGPATGRAGGGQNQSVVKAWLLAGAERWRKGAGANIKRLEVAKARAAANQVKESRQVSERRTVGPAGCNNSGGSGGSGKGSSGRSAAGGGAGDGGKGLDRKTGAGVKGPKNTGPSSNRTPGPSGSGNTGGRGNGSSTTQTPKTPTGAGKNSPAPKGSRTDTANGGGKPSKTPAAGGSQGSSGGPKTGTPGPAGKAGPAGKDGKADKPPTGTGPKSGTTTAPKADSTTGPGKPGTGAKPDPSSPQPPKKPTPTTAPAADTAKKDTKSPKEQPGTGSTPAPKDNKKPGSGKQDQDLTGATPTTPSGKPLNTQGSRETGYRDGTRAGRTAAHVKAYRDGVKDGWADTAEAAARDKARLDQARQQRKTAPKEPQPVPPKPTTPPTVQPLPVKDINASHLFLGDGAARESLSRGEVRSLKNFERRLEEKAANEVKIAETTRGLKAHADAQAAKVTQLVEDARAVKGGIKLLGALAKLEEDAKAQAAVAEEIYKRAVRAADACKAVLANVQTRYSAMYQAVVDSPETAPAETRFYLGDRNG